ncbi:MAG: hypothetical protein JSR36_15080 [Proteobacteria bacterium]|nr:hypothetical protein [Pseudomonadota bacterium]
MSELSRALADIQAIKAQLARSAQFHGYGAGSVCATALLALLAGLLQGIYLPDPVHQVELYLVLWVSTAGVALLIIEVDAFTRAQRLHPDMAWRMFAAAGAQFLPAILGGVLLTGVLLVSCRASLWMLPGLWQLVFSLGVFSSCTLLPRAMPVVGVWYMASGLMYLAGGQTGRALSPWAMAVPFAIGQLLVAAVLHLDHRDHRETDDRSRTPGHPSLRL